MEVTILIPSLLRKYVDNRETVQVSGMTVRECIDILKDSYPQLEKWLYKDGKIAAYVHVSLNKKKASLEDRVEHGDEIKILVATGGG